MNLHRAIAWALLCSGVGFGVAQAQSTTITTGPNGQLSGSASAGNAPSVSMSAGAGQVSGAMPPGPEARYGQGRSMTVRSPDGAASSSVWTSGPGTSVMAGAGSPGSTITTSSDGRPDAAGVRHHSRRHHRHWKHRS